MRNDIAKAIQAGIAVPPHVMECAAACSYDLMNGPSWMRIPQGDVTQIVGDFCYPIRSDTEEDREPGDIVESTYTGKVGDCLREFIDSLPSDGYVDTDCDYFSESAPPESWFDEEANDGEGEWLENDLSSFYHVSRKEIVEALFGSTIARDFN